MRWLVRAVLLLAGAALLLGSMLALLMFILSLAAGASWLWGLAGAAASTAGLVLGAACILRARRPPGEAASAGGQPVRLGGLIFAMAVPLAAVALIVHFTGRWGWYLAPWTMPLLLILTPAVVVVHELGHALAGALVGFRFQFVQFGPFRLLRTPAGVRLQRNQPLPSDIHGLQASLPGGDAVSVPRLIAHAAGGPVLNVATTALAFAIAAASEPVWSPAGEAVLAGLKLVGIVSAFGALNLVPFRTPSGHLSDGALIVHYLRADPHALSAAMQAWKKHALALRPREWGIPARELAAWAAGPAPTGPWLLLLALGVALDEGDHALARELLGRTDGVREPLVAFELARQAALLDALEGGVARARERLAALGKAPWQPGYGSLADAAVLAAEGRASEAGEALARWDRYVAASSPTARVGNEWAEEAIRARLAGTSLAPHAGPGSHLAVPQVSDS